MKSTTRFLVIVFLILGMLMTSFPAAAEAEHIPVSGACWIIGWVDNPDFRYWDTNNGSHWRHAGWLIQCDLNDPRLPQYLVGDDNWNLRWDEDGDVSHSHGYSFSTDEFGNPTNLWEGHVEAQALALTYEDDLWNMTDHIVMKGLGIYQGYLFTSTWHSTPEGIYLVEGELLVPNGK
jgi:hypothetical protein